MWDVQAEQRRQELERYAEEWDREAAWVASIPQEDRATTKARYWLASGLTPRRHGLMWLVPSSRRNDAVYRVRGGFCECQAAQNGRTCWHVIAVRIVTESDLELVS